MAIISNTSDLNLKHVLFNFMRLFYLKKKSNRWQTCMLNQCHRIGNQDVYTVILKTTGKP